MHKFVYIPVSEHFSFAKIIHPLDRRGISRKLLNSMIIAQVHLALGTIKGNENVQLCHTTQCHRCLKLRERAIGMLTAGMSNRAVVRERVSTPAQDLHIQFHHLQNRLRRGWCWGVILSVITPFCGEKLILIGWAWLPSGWAYAIPGPVMWNPYIWA